MRVRFVQPLIPAYREPFYRELARSGVELEVWADLAPSQGSLEGTKDSGAYRRVDAPYRAIGPVIWQPAMRRAADPSACDVLVLGGNVRHLQLQSTLARARARGLPTLLWMHGLGRTGHRLSALLRRRACRLASGVVAYSRRVRQELIDDGLDADVVFVASNGLDQSGIDAAIETWTGDPSRLAEFQRAESIEDREVLLSIGRLEPDKRADLLIEALAILARDRPRLEVVLIGKGSAEPALRALAAARGVAERVRFLGALHEPQQIAPWALSSQMLVHPGAIGLTVFLAFGFGLPVVTCDDRNLHGPEADAIESGTNGLLVPPDDVQALARAIASLLDDRAMREQFARAAAATVRGPEGHSVSAMVSGFRAAFDAVRDRPRY